MSAYSLPVLMYHYVSRFPGAIAVSPEHFEDQCRGMAEHGWRGIGLDEAEGFLLKGAPLPPRSLLITFDDGYLDNYVYAWPILRKYGHKGVVFAVTERMEAEKKCRPTLADVWEGLPPSSLPPVDAPMHDTPFGYQVRRDMFFSLGRSPTHGIQRRHVRGRALRPPPRRFRRSGMGPGEPPRQAPEARLRTGSRRATLPRPRNAGDTFNGGRPFPKVWGPCPRFKERPLPVQRALHPFP